MFEQASRLKLRFKATNGVLSVEDLWDLTLEQLDKIAKTLRKDLREEEDESFISIKKTNSNVELQFNIVKHIIDVKLQEKADRAMLREKQARREQILQILAKKQNETLESMSESDLLKELENL